MDTTSSTAVTQQSSAVNAPGPSHGGQTTHSWVPPASGPSSQQARQNREATLRKLRSEAVRLRTFRAWTHTAIPKEELARAGFFYFNVQDQVQCAFCLVVVGNWEPNDNAFVEHRTHSARCPFVLGLPVGNVPINANPAQETPNVFVGSRISEGNGSPSGMVVRATAEPEKGLKRVADPRLIQCAQPRFCTYEARMSTFRLWPRLPQTPDQMAKAGLYYTGYSDEVKCFKCGGTIRGWDKHDVPMIEHARLHPTCQFVREFCGEDTKLPISMKSDEPEKDEPIPAGDSKNLPFEVSCKICLEKPLSIVLLPCAHMCACAGCFGALTKCPVCRKAFVGYVKAQIVPKK